MRISPPSGVLCAAADFVVDTGDMHAHAPTPLAGARGWGPGRDACVLQLPCMGVCGCGSWMPSQWWVPRAGDSASVRAGRLVVWPRSARVCLRVIRVWRLHVACGGLRAVLPARPILSRYIGSVQLQGRCAQAGRAQGGHHRSRRVA